MKAKQEVIVQEREKQLAKKQREKEREIERELEAKRAEKQKQKQQIQSLSFKFDEDEPQIFAWTGENDSKDEEPKVMFTITNTKDSYITFTHKNGKSFKLFARELTDEGKQLRNKQIELTKANLQNESTNKEA